jgi:hypothetical protein
MNHTIYAQTSPRILREFPKVFKGDESASIQSEVMNLLSAKMNTASWMVMRVGISNECAVCNGICTCKDGPLPPLEHEMLSVGVVFENIGNAVYDLAENGYFPENTIISTKLREEKAGSIMSFRKVKQGKLIGVKLADVYDLIDWGRIKNIVKRRKKIRK